MKAKIFIAAAAVAASALLVGCNKTLVIPSEEEPSADYSPASLTVNIPLGDATKAVGTGTEADEKKLTSVQVMIFTEAGNLEASKTSASGSLELSCTKGSKTVAAVVNAAELTGVKTLSELRARTYALTDNNFKSFVMYGQKAVSVNAANVAVTLEVQRLASKVVIKKITNALELQQYQSTPVQVKGIYLINVAGNTTFAGAAPTLWLNKMKNEASADCLYYEKPAALSVAYKASDATSHCFYCYPNPTADDNSQTSWSARHTRLVVEATVGGHLCYYPMTLPKLAGNTVYTIGELTITRLGVDKPDVDSVMGGATFTLSIAPWKEETVESVTI